MSISPKTGDDSKAGAATERVVATSAAVELPLLTKTNYHEWSLVMQVSLDALGLWAAVEADKAERREDRLALAAILRAVRAEMKAGLAVKKSAKEVWAAVKMMRIGDDRVNSTSVQRLMKEFENVAERDGESVDDLTMRINGLVASLRELGEDMVDSRVVKKILRVVPKRLKPVAMAIEMFTDFKVVTVEEVVGRLRVAEDAIDDEVKEVTNGTGQLLLTEAQWDAKRRQRSGKQQVYGGGARRGGGENSGGHGGDHDEDDDGGSSNASSERGGSRYRGRCFDCGERGHMAKNCPRKKKERALLCDVDDDEAVLF